MSRIFVGNQQADIAAATLRNLGFFGKGCAEDEQIPVGIKSADALGGPGNLWLQRPRPRKLRHERLAPDRKSLLLIVDFRDAFARATPELTALTKTPRAFLA